MHVERKKKRQIAVLVSLAVLVLMIMPAFLALQLPKGPASLDNYPRILSSKQPLLLNQSAAIELGYGPSSLIPVSQQLPVYTVNDELWLESNYNTTIRVDLVNSEGTFVQSTLAFPRTIVDLFSFNSTLVTQYFTLDILANCNLGCQSYSYPIQFVNPSDETISPFTSHYSISNSTLSISFASPALEDKFNIEQCLSSVNSDSAVEIPLPISFGGGYVGVTGDPATLSATIVPSGAIPSAPFAFSFELLGNYTSALPNANGSNVDYTSSELEVAQSDSVLVQRGGQQNDTMVLSTLAPLRSGRYVLRATFQNSNGVVQVNTPLLIESPYSSDWFWLGGACMELNAVSPTFTSQISLSGPPNSWPRYLYLMYQAVPGIEGYANVSLALSLDRVRFVSGSKNATLPPYIQVSYLENESDPSGILDSVINNNGVVYLVTNGTYPVRTTFALSFGGVIFDRSNLVLRSPYIEVLENIQLANLIVLVTENGKGLSNATVTIFSRNLNSSITLTTPGNGVAQTLLPPGNYTIYVENNGRTQLPVQDYFVAGSTYSIPVNFPGPVNYGAYLDWVIVAITIIGVVGNLWFWLAKRRIRNSLE